MEWPGEIPAIFYFLIILNHGRRHFFGDPEFDFLISAEEKLSRCDTESD